MYSSNSYAPNHSVKILRLCLDPKNLNKALEREPYYSRLVDELISRFSSAILLTVVDMNEGYR